MDAISQVLKKLSHHLGPPLTVVGIIIGLLLFSYLFVLFLLLWLKKLTFFFIAGAPLFIAILTLAIVENVSDASTALSRLFGWLQVCAAIGAIAYLVWLIGFRV